MVPEKSRVLVVDDEESMRDSLTIWFEKDGYEVTAASSGTEALRAFQTKSFDIVLLDIKMPGMDGMEVLERIRKVDPQVDVIMITAFAAVDTAVRALRLGALDYVTKPIDPDELSLMVSRAFERRRLQQENTQLRETIDEMTGGADTIVGDSPRMRKVLELAQHVAQTDATVLIRGESGTGKELVARAIHANSQRRYFPIVPVNCGALPESLLESELFGHEKGAFTGAAYRRKGKLEMASGGTLFLDEVGTITPKTQVDLLRVLETKELTRIGGTRPVKTDFRVICATNEDLEAAVADGRFREDLYYRINVFTVVVPPLRERRSDIQLLAEHFLRRFAAQMDKRISGFEPGVLDHLMEYDWPGNVRELANAIERATVVGRPPAIRLDDLPALATSAEGRSLASIERRHIASVLEENAWNVSRSARVLKIDRATLYNKIKKYGMHR
jgi:DNA-binding NtrC family response regulator